MNNLIPGKQLADTILKDIATAVQSKNSKPKLSIILASNDQSSKVYVDLKMKKAREVGIETELFTFDHSVSVEELVEKIKQLNQSSTNGILLQLPLYSHLERHSEEIVNTIDSSKDVDGLTAYQQGLCSHLSDNAILPATVEAILECIQYTTTTSILWNNRQSTEFQSFLKSKNVVIINDSNLIGRPLAMLLNSMGATVTLCNQYTIHMRQLLINADYIISATGKVQLFDHTYIKQGSVVIDVTSVQTSDGVKGDFVINDELLSKASFITPVPGGVGPLTIACLLRNMM